MLNVAHRLEKTRDKEGPLALATRRSLVTLLRGKARDGEGSRGGLASSMIMGERGVEDAGKRTSSLRSAASLKGQGLRP